MLRLRFVLSKTYQANAYRVHPSGSVAVVGTKTRALRHCLRHVSFSLRDVGFTKAVFQIEDRQQDDIVLSFDRIDINGDGVLNFGEIHAAVTCCSALTALSIEEQHGLALRILRECDTNDDGLVGRTEFEAAVQRLKHASSSEVCLPSQFGASGGIAFSQPLLLSRLQSAFGVHDFSKDELVASFDRMDTDRSGCLTEGEIHASITSCKALHDLSLEDQHRLAMQILRKCDTNNDGNVSRSEFEDTVRRLGEEVDVRLWPAAVGMASAGISMSLLVPAMPLLEQKLALSTADVGCIVGAVAFSGVLTNIPGTCLSDMYGRRRLIVAGSLLCGFAMGSVVLASNTLGLLAGRVVGGLGVTLLTVGGFMFANDVSTPLNRGRSVAPLQCGYVTGTAMGPVIGGILISNIGLEATFTGAASSFVVLAAVTQLFANETNPNKTASMSIVGTVHEQLKHWPPLLRQEEVRHMVGTAAAYWAILGGAQLTVLPLMLADVPYSLSPSGVAAIFSISSCVVVGSMPFVATFVDRVPKPAAILLGSAVMGCGLCAVPIVPEIAASLDVPAHYCAGALMGVWTVGATALSNAPQAWLPDLAQGPAKAPCLALLFTGIDLGFLLGSAGAGMVAVLMPKPLILQSLGVSLVSWGTWVHTRYFLRLKSSR